MRVALIAGFLVLVTSTPAFGRVLSQDPDTATATPVGIDITGCTPDHCEGEKSDSGHPPGSAPAPSLLRPRAPPPPPPGGRAPYRGLEKAARRSAYEALARWDRGRSVALGDHIWLFYSGDKGRRGNFKHAFDSGEIDRGQLGAGPRTRLVAMNDVYTPTAIQSLVPEIGQLGPLESWVGDAVISLEAAKRAAADGGAVALLMGKGDDLDEEGRYWSRFESYVLTQPGTRVTKILRYDAEDFKTPPRVVWKTGDRPIGEEPDFREEPKPMISW